MAGWTDYIADWSGKDKLRLCSTYDAIRALRDAVNERGSVIGDSDLPAVNRLYPVKYYVDLIDAKIKSIVPFFVDHTQDDGTFLNTYDIPMWTNGAIREYGLRPDGTQKEMGFLGEIVSAEDPEMVFTEISVGINIDGTEMDVPTLVPTLTDEELLYMITEGYKVAPSEWPDTIIEKASLHAQQRIAAGKSPFAADGEQDYTRSWITYRNSRLMPVIDWVYQRYQIINKLRWSREFIYARYTEQTRTLGDGWGGTFEAALNSAYSNIETTVQIGGVFSVSLIANNIRCIRYSNEYYARYFSSQCKFEITISSIPFDYDAELYIMFYPLTSVNSLHSSIFDGCGMFKKGASLVYSTSMLANQELIPLIACGDASLYPTSPPLTPPWDGINTWESAIGNDTNAGEELRLIRKFTGANGFQFKDW